MSPADVLARIAHDVANPQAWAVAVERTGVLAAIVIAAWTAASVVSAALRRAAHRPGRAVTYTPVVESAARYTIAFVALMLMLETVNINVTAILASAGILSLAFGFGAQYMIRDVLAGLFLLSEGVVQIGDLVRIDGDTGVVERVTLRILQIRKFNGELLTIPNGAVTKIGNLSRGFGRAVVQITLPYASDVGRALATLRDVAHEWTAAHPDEALADPSVDGAVDFKDTGVTVQLSVQVRPGRQAPVEAELRRRALDALTAQQIKIDTRVSVTI